MALHTETKIYKHAYQLLNLSIEAKANMRRDFKNSLGSRIHDECIEVLVLIADANAAPNSDKPPVIRQMLRHFGDAAVNDPPEQTRFDTREWRDGTWHDAGKPDFWDTMGGEIDDTQCVGRVGKKAAGRLLDGRTWDEVPA